MRTAFRGGGAYKVEFLRDLIARFGTLPFTFREARAIPGFTVGTFRKLHSDGWLEQKRGKRPSFWRVRETAIAQYGPAAPLP